MATFAVFALIRGEGGNRPTSPPNMGRSIYYGAVVVVVVDVVVVVVVVAVVVVVVVVVEVVEVQETG